MLKQAVVDAVIPCTWMVGDAFSAVLKRSIPHPQVERVEVLRDDARLGIADEFRAHAGRFGEAEAEIAAPEAVADVLEDVIRVLVACVKMRRTAVPGLVDGDERF